MKTENGKNKKKLKPETIRKSNHKIIKNKKKEKPQKRHLTCFLIKKWNTEDNEPFKEKIEI